MIDEKRVLALIPARGGSKGIPHKNIIKIAGKPLIDYSIIAAEKSRYIDRVIVSTDSEEIMQEATRCGADAPFLRPGELATDTATTIDVVMHALSEVGKHVQYDILVLLQPTSPLRTAEDIDKALEKFVKGRCRPLAAVSPVSDHPRLIRRVENDWEMEKLLSLSSTVRRQDMEEYYRINGSIYINLVSEINDNTSLNDNEIPFVMEQSHSLDIDDPKDIVLAEYYLGDTLNS